jgi:DNA repair photolyase
MCALKLDTVRPVRCRSILTTASGYLHAFTHTLNPYMGCAFGDGGCGVYCYVAESPIGIYAGQPWGTWVNAKTNAAEALLRVTRSVVEILREQPIGLLVVQTRSPIVERDFDLLAEMPFAGLSMTVETDDDRVRRALTPICPGIDRRLAVMRRARERGIKVQAAVSPALPHDTERFADLLVGAADRVVVDTFLGDGAAGGRTRRRPLPRRYVELGWGDWRDVAGARRLHAALCERMGPERVGWGREGFNGLADRPLAVEEPLFFRDPLYSRAPIWRRLI